MKRKEFLVGISAAGTMTLAGCVLSNDENPHTDVDNDTGVNDDNETIDEFLKPESIEIHHGLIHKTKTGYEIEFTGMIIGKNYELESKLIGPDGGIIERVMIAEDTSIGFDIGDERMLFDLGDQQIEGTVILELYDGDGSWLKDYSFEIKESSLELITGFTDETEYEPAFGGYWIDLATGVMLSGNYPIEFDSVEVHIGEHAFVYIDAALQDRIVLDGAPVIEEAWEYPVDSERFDTMISGLISPGEYTLTTRVFDEDDLIAEETETVELPDPT